MMDSESGWLLLGYTLPKEPSRLRVSIWRRLRKIGAVYTHQGFWILPNCLPFSSEILPLIEELRRFNGEVLGFTASDLDPNQIAQIKEKFLKARNEEYEEMYGQCAKFLAHVDHAIVTERFTFAEVDELEEELLKIERWHDEIKARDVFGASQGLLALNGVTDCRKALQDFTEKAFDRVGEGEAEDSSDSSP